MKIILFNPRIVFEMTIKWQSKDYINDNKREKGEIREYLLQISIRNNCYNDLAHVNS